MKALTIRKIPSEVADAVRHRAAEMHLSLNKAIIALLQEKLGTGKKRAVLHNDLDHLAGQWSREETERFEQSLADQRSIDKDLWK